MYIVYIYMYVVVSYKAALLLSSYTCILYKLTNKHTKNNLMRIDPLMPSLQANIRFNLTILIKYPQMLPFDCTLKIIVL